MFKAWGEGLGMKKARVIVLGSENGNDEEELSGTAYLQEKLNRSDVWSRDLENVLWSMSWKSYIPWSLQKSISITNIFVINRLFLGRVKRYWVYILVLLSQDRASWCGLWVILLSEVSYTSLSSGAYSGREKCVDRRSQRWASCTARPDDAYSHVEEIHMYMNNCTIWEFFVSKTIEYK